MIRRNRIDSRQCIELIFGLLQNKSLDELIDCMHLSKCDIYCAIQHLQKKYGCPQDIEAMVSKFLKDDFMKRYWQDIRWLK